MNARRLILASLALACVTLGLALSGVPAQAEVTHKYLSQLTGFEYTSAIAFDASGDVYVADVLARTVDRFSPAGTPLAFSASESYIKKSKLTGIPTGAGGSSVLRFGDPSGVAVNNENGDVYVSDAGQHVVDVFSSTGEYLSQLTGTPLTASVSGPFKDPRGLAVDQSTHHLYVADPENGVVDVFSSTGAYVSQFGAGVLSGSFGESIAVNDLTEDVYVGDRGTGTVDVFDSMGGSLMPEWSGASTPGGSFGSGEVNVGLDPTTDHVYVAHHFVAGFAAVDEFDGSTSEEYLGQLTGTPSSRFEELEAVAVDPTNGDLYVGSERTVVDVFGPDVTVPDVTVQAASGVGKNTVALSGSVDPAGIQVSSCEFEYGPSTSYGQSVPCEQTPAQIGAGNSPVTVTAKPVVEAGAEYHFRLNAANAGGSNASEDETFTTPTAVDALSTGAAEDVTPNTAKLTGSLSPDGADTHYYFQYGTEETFGSTSPALPGSDAGSASGSVSATTSLTGLVASTTYQYRLVGVNSFGTTYGQEESFTTSPAVEGLSTGPAQDVAAGGAKLTGSLSPNGTDAHYYFEYGSTASYGSISPALPGTDAGTAGVVSAETSLSGLEGGTHHYRLVAVNSFGTTYGADRTFFLPGPAANGHYFSGSFGAEGPGATSFGRSDIQSIAVDESTGDVYVYSGYPGELYKFNSSGEPVDFSSTGTNSISVGGFGGGEDEVAVDNSSGPDQGDFYVADGGQFGEGVKVYESGGSEVGELNGGVESLGAPWGEACGVAVDPEGNVYVSFGDGENAKDEIVNHVNKYMPAGPAGTPLSNSDYTSTLTHTGLNKSCDIAADSKGDVYLDTHPQGPVVEYRASQFGESQAVGTTLDERGNTIAVEPGGGHEVYIDEGSDVAQYGGTGGLLGKFAGSGLGAVKNSVGVAVNASTREVYVADEEGTGEAKVNIFSAVPAGPPTVQGSVADVASTSATLQAQIDPNGRDTHYYFQYGTVDCATSPSSCTDVPAAPGQDIGSGEFDQTVSIHPQNLSPDTLYHFRVVAVNVLDETTDGADETFTTQPGGSELVLPDGRAWELVSPANKNGSLIEPFSEGGVIEASAEGSAITYMASAPVGANPPTNNNESQLLSTRSSGGWSTQDISSPHDAPVGPIIGAGQEYRFFSEDLSLGALDPRGETPLSPQTTEPTAYLHHAANGEFQPLVTAANAPEGTEFGGKIGVIAGTPDLSHLVIGGVSGLDPHYPDAGDMYEWSAGGQLQLVTILPNGVPAISNGSSVDTNLGGIRHAISSDGSRVIWSAQGQAEPFSGHELYLRDMTKGETVQVNADQGGPTGRLSEGEPQYQTADSEGSRVFFTDAARLTADSTAHSGYQEEEPDLYMFEVSSAGGEPLAGKLTDLTVDSHTGESADVQGVLPGASEDGSYVYVVAKGVLSDTENAQKETATPGERNLYVLHDAGNEWTTTFIATLSSDDESDWIGNRGSLSNDLTNLTSRVSPDGQYFAFMSDRNLTGYDNTDVNSGEPDQEVFLYDAGSNRTICASCNPSGARPEGVLDPEKSEGTLLIDRNSVLEGKWLAASVPGWTAVSLTEAFYQSRYLSDSGRLFFDSPDALVPQDTDGKENVYEYEPEGIGSCGSASVTFSERSGGCVDLISAGTSGEESAFLDASANGEDVFFLTTSKLVSEDYDSAFDVYDARVCSASASCPAAPVSPPPCTTADSCKPAPSPQPAIFGPPPSGTFSGAGNVVGSPPVSSVPTKKSLTRAQKLSKALKACEGKRKMKARTACKARARKLYGPRSTVKRSTKHAKKGKK